MKIFISILTFLSLMTCGNNQDRNLITSNWEVIELGPLREFEKAPNMQIDIEKNRVNGYSGCNQFFSDLTVESNSILFGNVGSTRMMCQDMTVEDAFFAAVGKIATYKFEDENLILLSEDKEELMTLKPLK